MKKKLKLLISLVLLSSIGFLFTSCQTQDDLLNTPIYGDWEREGQYVVTFKDNGGYFKSLTGGMWLDAKNNDNISIGEKCYKNIKSTNNENEWECKIRIYNSYRPHETLRWEDCILTLNSNENIIYVNLVSTSSSFTLKKNE